VKKEAEKNRNKEVDSSLNWNKADISKCFKTDDVKAWYETNCIEAEMNSDVDKEL
jgi:hypothetical protein